ncbi:MAG: hypothetical protein ACLR70_02755 [Streptococcus thermophilus]
MKQFKHKKFIGLALIVFESSWYLENTLRARLLHRLQEFMPQPLSIRIPGTRCV